MRIQDFSDINLDRIMTEINYDIKLLYVVPCAYARNLILNHLRDRMYMVESITKAMFQPVQLQPQPLPFQPGVTPILDPLALLQPMTPENQSQTFTVQKLSKFDGKSGNPALLQPMAPGNQSQTFTLQELSKFDGKGGNPAYVAVNGTVYDVTNNAAWAAATHFGLLAGKDLTNEFASCHASQPILSKLKEVGKLV